MATNLRAEIAAIRGEARRRVRRPDAPSAESILGFLLDGCPIAALVANNAGLFASANTAASALTGYSLRDLQRLSMWQLTPNTADHEAEVLWRAFIAQHEQSGDYRLLVKGGRIIEARYAAVANVLPGLHLSLLERADAR